MAEEHMYFHLVLDRWGDDAVWPTIVETYFKDIPKLLRGFVTNGLRKTLLKGMNTQGLGRLTRAERMQRLEPDLRAISVRLAHSDFLFGASPTAADASVGALLMAMRSTPGQTPLTDRIGQDTVLSAYIDRVHAALGRSSS